MPINYKDYPKDWKQIVAKRKEKCNDKCELCYAPNGELVTRNSNAEQYPWAPGWVTKVIVGPLGDKVLKKTRIVLTLHHIDSDKSNSQDQNLILLCQRCHLRLDLAKHMKKRAANRRARG